mgnify:CR=1 FL=1
MKTQVQGRGGIPAKSAPEGGASFLFFKMCGKVKYPPVPPRKRRTGGRGGCLAFSWRRVWAWTGAKTCHALPRQRRG